MKRLNDNAALIPAALVGLAVLGAAIRWVVAGQDLFADELATYWIVSTNDLSGVVDTVSTTAEISPPLGFMLTWLTSRPDLSPELIRLSALIAGIASIPLVYAIGVRTVGRGAGLAAAAFTALSPFMIFYSAEARGYGVMMAFVLLSTLALLRALDDGGRRWWVAYAAFIALAAYTHYTSVFVLAGQFAWALWLHPAARKPLLIATAAAALAYVPWLPSLKGDIDSPTTDILGGLLTFDLPSLKYYVSHWLVGLPYGNVAGLRDLPGLAGLLLIAAGLALGAAGLWRARAQLREWFAATHNRILLVAVLAAITPLAEAFLSLVGTNIFSTRNLAASWPYMALLTAALITVGGRPQRITATFLVALGLGIGAAKMLTDDYERPHFTEVAEWRRDDPRGVLVDSASLTPGPLANFDVEGADPGVPVFRLNSPEQMTQPFGFGDRLPDPAELADRVSEAAGDEPITIVRPLETNPIAGAGTESALVRAFVDGLPSGYELVDSETFGGFLEALVYERPAPPD